MLDIAQQVKTYFAELNVTYADLIKKMMAVNEAQDESLKHFFENWDNEFAIPVQIISFSIL